MKKRPNAWKGATLRDTEAGGVLENLRSMLTPPPSTQPHSESASRTATQPKSAEHSKAKFAKKPRAHVKAPPPSKPKRLTYESMLPAEVVRRVYQQLEEAASETHRTSTAAVAAPGFDFGKAAFEALSRLRPALEFFRADHRAPNSVPPSDVNIVRARIRRGAASLHRIVDRDADGYIGYDFGTSSTKAVVRWPLLPRSPAFAVPVPAGWSSGSSPHIWPTVVHYHPETKIFSALPCDGFIALSGFKSALIEGAGHRMMASAGVTVQQATVAFLAMHIAYVIGAVAERSRYGISCINFAVPVASLSNARVQTTILAAVNAALRLVPRADEVTLDAVLQALRSTEAPALPCEMHAELSGVIAGYCRSPRRHAGAHMIIDCGSATLDMATFQLTDSHWPIGIYASAVERLGTDSLVAYQASGATWSDCINAVGYEDHLVCSRTLKQESVVFGQNTDRKFTYQLILAGGGIEHPQISGMLERWQPAYTRRFYKPDLDPGLECEQGSASSRLILADGLAWDPISLRQVALPRPEVAAAPLKPHQHDWTSN